MLPSLHCSKVEWCSWETTFGRWDVTGAHHTVNLCYLTQISKYKLNYWGLSRRHCKFYLFNIFHFAHNSIAFNHFAVKLSCFFRNFVSFAKVHLRTYKYHKILPFELSAHGKNCSLMLNKTQYCLDDRKVVECQWFLMWRVIEPHRNFWATGIVKRKMV